MNNSEKNVSKKILRKIFVCSCLFYQQIDSQHQLKSCYPEYYFEHAPTLELRYIFIRFKAEKMPSVLAFVTCESKSNLTMFRTSLINKLLFRGISF